MWLVHDPSKYKKYETENVKFVEGFKKHSTIRHAVAYRYALTSRYIFYTQAFNWIGMARKGQTFIDLWHGCGYKANKNNRKVFFDYCLVPGDVFIKTKMEFFGCSSKKLLELHPKNSILDAAPRSFWPSVIQDMTRCWQEATQQELTGKNF